VAALSTLTRTALYPFVWKTAAASSVTIVSAAMSRRRGLVASPSRFVNTLYIVEDEKARYGGCFDGTLRMQADTVVTPVHTLRSRLPRRGLFPLCLTALVLRYLACGSYVDRCAVFGARAATLSKSLWVVIHSLNQSPSLDFEVELGCPHGFPEFAGGFQHRRRPPFVNVFAALYGVADRQDQILASEIQLWLTTTVGRGSVRSTHKQYGRGVQVPMDELYPPGRLPRLDSVC